MKIYEIGTGYTPIPAQMGAATEIVVEELTRAFRKLGEDVQIIDIATDNRAPSDLPILEVPVSKCFSGTDVKLGIMHKLKRVMYSVSLAQTLHKLLKNSDEEVVLHFHNQYNLFFFLKLVSPAVRAKAKIAYTVHSYIWAAEWEKIESTVRKRYFQELHCVKNADYVMVLNDKTAQHFTQRFNVPAERIHKIGNGVNTDVYRIMSDAECSASKCSLGFDGKRVVFQVGSVCDRKNQLGAVKMLKDYLQSHPDVVYAYAGGVIDPVYHDELQQYARDNHLENQIRYVGELCPGEQLNQYYNAAELTVFPSKQESFGLVIIESLSTGTPVLVASKPLFDLETGCTVYHSDSEFVRYVDNFLLESGAGNQIREEVCTSYSWGKIAADHVDIWNIKEKKSCLKNSTAL